MAKIVTPEEQKAIISSGLGKYELQLVNSFNAPLFWTIRKEDGTLGFRNGTAFFLNAGQRPFGVTAWHVVEGWKRSRAEQGGERLQLAGDQNSLAIDWAARVIDEDPAIDIATFFLTDDEVKSLGKTVMTGAQKRWPPQPPPKDCVLYYCGFPAVGTRQHPLGGPLFGALPGMGTATSVSDKRISILLEREYLVPLLGGGIPPENFDFGGVSGGPVIKIVETSIRSYALAGIVYQGPNTTNDPDQAIPGFELISARHAHFILPDGRLDLARWRSLDF